MPRPFATTEYVVNSIIQRSKWIIYLCITHPQCAVVGFCHQWHLNVITFTRDIKACSADIQRGQYMPKNHPSSSWQNSNNCEVKTFSRGEILQIYFFHQKSKWHSKQGIQTRLFHSWQNYLISPMRWGFLSWILGERNPYLHRFLHWDKASDQVVLKTPTR